MTTEAPLADRIAAFRRDYPLTGARQTDEQIAAMLPYMPGAAGEHCQYCGAAEEELETVRESTRHRRGSWVTRCVYRLACAERQRERKALLALRERGRTAGHAAARERTERTLAWRHLPTIERTDSGVLHAVAEDGISLCGIEPGVEWERRTGLRRCSACERELGRRAEAARA